jgi:hypothetical protein
MSQQLATVMGCNTEHAMNFQTAGRELAVRGPVAPVPPGWPLLRKCQPWLLGLVLR